MRTQQERTIRSYNMHLVSGKDCDGNMWPTLRPVDVTPSRLTVFCAGTAGKNTDAFAHFYIDDYRFARVWNHAVTYVPVLKNYAGVIAPDFSLYTDMPYPMQMWNKYRSMALAHYWQKCGIEVIPSITFSDESSYEWVFDGLPKHSTLATSTVGVCRTKAWREAFRRGIEEACRRLEPTRLVINGSKVDFDANGAEVCWYKNENSARVKANIAKRAEAGPNAGGKSISQQTEG